MIRESRPHISAVPSPPAGLRERNKAQKRERIKRAAKAVFAQCGYEDATVREIAARANVGKGTVFLYARDKHDLLMMVVNDELDELSRRTFATMPGNAVLLEQLVHVFALRYKYWVSDLGLSRYALHEMHGSFANGAQGDVEPERFQERRHQMIDELARLVAAAQSAGAVDTALDARTGARFVLDLYIGESRQWLSLERPTARAGIARLREVLELALRAFAPQPSIL